MHCLLIFFSWGLLAPKPLGVFRYRLLSYTSTWDCSSMLNLRCHCTFLVFLMDSVSYKFYSFWMVSVLISTYRISALLASKDYYIGASRWFHLMDSSLLWWRASGCSYVVLFRSSNRILLLVLIDNGWCLPPSRLINRRKGVRRFAHLSDDR